MSLPAPAPAPQARQQAAPPWLASAVHDLKGAASAIGGLASLAQASRDPAAFEAIHARAELLEHLADALAVLQGAPPRGKASWRLAWTRSGARLKKFLSRAQVSLKSLGETPDGEYEARRLGVLAETVLVAAVNAKGWPGPSIVEARCELLTSGQRFVASFADPAWAMRLQGLLAPVASPQENQDADVSSVAARQALDDLGSRMLLVDGPAGGLDVVIELPEPEADEAVAQASRGRRNV